MEHGEEGVSTAGVGLIRYTRRPEVEAEIAALPGGVGTDFRVAVAGATALETVVHTIRRLRRAGDDAGTLALTDVLIKKATPALERAARRQFPQSLDDQQDVMQLAAIQLWREVADTSPKEEFWEVNFAGMLVRACSDAARKIRGQREHERPFRRSEDGAWDEELLQPDPKFSDRDDRAFLSGALLAGGLDQLEGDVRRAVYLKMKGLRIDSKDPNAPTIARTLGVSGRTVQTYLRQGEDTLRRWLQQNA